jgi:hypothetical protein
MKSQNIVLVCLLVSSHFACQPDASSESNFEVVLPDKADNFFSMRAEEYVLEGQSQITLLDEWQEKTQEEKVQRANELAEKKLQAIEHYILYNFNSGSFISFLLNRSQSEDFFALLPSEDDLKFSFVFRLEISAAAGYPNEQFSLLDWLSGELDKYTNANGEDIFTVTLPDLTESELENNWWWRPAGDKPILYDQVKLRPEIVEMRLYSMTSSRDAWIDYNQSLADDELTIAIHYGYHNYDQQYPYDKHYKWLLNNGFTAPCSFSYLDIDSGPFMKTIEVNGRSVSVKVWMYWRRGYQTTEALSCEEGQELYAKVKESLASMDVIIYDGHSSGTTAFTVSECSNIKLREIDIPNLDLPQDKYQIIALFGCSNYNMGKSFLLHPNKIGRDKLDVITTSRTMFRYSDDTRVIFETLFGSRKEGLKAHKFSELLWNLEEIWTLWSPWFGIQGIDDNPRIHPWADEADFCTPCNQQSECGRKGAGFLCAQLEAKQKSCLPLCIDSDGCPQGYYCLQVAEDGNYGKDRVCVPNTFSCLLPAEQYEGPFMLINEVLPNPISHTTTDLLAGDANNDGVSHYVTDEFIEIVNISDDSVKLDGWSIHDASALRYIFPHSNIWLEAGQAIAVFGGDLSSVVNPVFGLSLDNFYDRVILKAPNGTIVDEMSYVESTAGVSWTRQVDGVKTSGWVLHDFDTKFSPGVKQGGSEF